MKDGGGRPVHELIRSDGTIDLDTGFQGTIDLSGYRMVTDRNGIPLFLPEDADYSETGLSDTSSISPSSGILSADNDYWKGGFGLGLNDAVYSLAVNDDILYAGGVFTDAAGGIPTNRIARWDGSVWTGIGELNGHVHALAVFGSDLYAGGAFNTVGGLTVNRIAKWDGHAWSELGEGMNNRVDALLVVGDSEGGMELYAGGWFTTAGGQPANRIAKWDGNAWSALGDGMNNVVSALAARPDGQGGSHIYAGGYFTTAGGRAANRIAKWDGQSWTALGTGMNGAVRALAVIGNNLYAGGEFTTAGGQATNYIARWNGWSWSGVEGSSLKISALNNHVLSLAVVGSSLYVGGKFTIIDGILFTFPNTPLNVNRIARWDGEKWSTLGSGMTGDVNVLAPMGNDLFAGGEFATAGGRTVHRIAKWSAGSWSELNSGMNGPVLALAMMDGNLYAGGEFTTAGGVTVNHIAKWDGTRWSAIGSGMNNHVRVLLVVGDHLYAGGLFTVAGGQTVNRIAKWDGTYWSALGAGMNHNVYDLAAFGNNLYAGGEFTSAGGATANRIARWNGEVWSALGSGMNDLVHALAAVDNDLYAGGYFTNAGGQAANRIAKWDGENWSALGSGMNNHVYTLAVSGSDLYAGGVFTIAGGATVNHIAKWDGEAWSALGTGANNHVHFLAPAGDHLFVGGRFTTAGGQTVNRIAKWDGENWSALGDGLNESIRTLIVSGNELYCGGNYTAVSGKTSMYVAHWVKPVAPAAVTRNFTTPLQTPLSFNELGNMTGVSLRISSHSGGSVVHVFRYNDAPENLEGLPEDTSSCRWIIQENGLGHPYQAELRFALQDIPGHGITNSHLATLYHRSSPGKGAFAELATTWDNENMHLVAGQVTGFGEFVLGSIPVGVEQWPDLPLVYHLNQNYPNPFNPSTAISYGLPWLSRVKIEIYNTLGQRVATLVNADMDAGIHETRWHPAGIASGLYLYRIEASAVTEPGHQYTETRTMLLIK